MKDDMSWKDFLAFHARVHKHSFNNAVLIYAQRPDATLVADMEIWNRRIGRWINRGAKSIAVFDDQSTVLRLKYLFDITDTNGQPYTIPKVWQLNPALEARLVEKLKANSLTEWIVKRTRESVLSYQQDIQKGLEKEIQKTKLNKLPLEGVTKQFMQMVIDSTEYMTAIRCSIREPMMSSPEPFKTLTDFSSKALTLRLGYVASTLSETILREIEREIKEIQKQQRGVKNNETSRTELQRIGRDLSSSDSNIERESVRPETSREIRADGTELPEGGTHQPVQLSSERRDTATDDASSESRSLGENGEPPEADASERTHRRSNEHLSELQTPGDDTNESRGDRSKGTNLQGEIDHDRGLPERSSFLMDLSDDEIIEKVLLRGSGFEGGKQRIVDFFSEEHTAKEKVDFLKREYGTGGSSITFSDNLSGFDNHDSKGISIDIYEVDKKIHLSWSKVASGIEALIDNGKYFEPRYKNDKPPVRKGIYQPSLFDLNGIENEITYEEDDETPFDEKGNENTDQTNPSKINYQFSPEDEIGIGGLKTKFRANIEAIKTLKVIEEEKRLATDKEQSILAKYVGWGGMPQVFDINAGGWNNEYGELKELLSTDEYDSAKASTPNAHYTTPVVIRGIYQALKQFGFKKGNILEPSMGIGNFYSHLPQSLQQSKLFGVELDDISGRIGKQMYQKAVIQIKGYEETDFDDNFFDVAIGNVPFGNYKVYDRLYDKHNFMIHDYFFAKTLDKVRPGGIIAFVTSKGTMDKKDQAVRKYISEKAELIGAIRLPNTAFKENANTDVTADILFLKKRERRSVEIPSWLTVSATKDGVPVNQYFLDHPHMMLGEMVFDERMFGKESHYTTCVNSDSDFNLEEALTEAVSHLKAEIGYYEKAKKDESVIPADPKYKNYSYAFIEDQLYYRENSTMRKMDYTGKTLERIQGMMEIRDITREIITIQTNGCTKEELGEKQEKLNQVYDAFVEAYGHITSRTNVNAFRDDNDYPLLCSLEVEDEDHNVTKADMFTKQTIKPKEVITDVDTAFEALTVSLNEKGMVDLSFMSQLYDEAPRNPN